MPEPMPERDAARTAAQLVLTAELRAIKADRDAAISRADERMVAACAAYERSLAEIDAEFTPKGGAS